jgi:hypothetical protein
MQKYISYVSILGASIRNENARFERKEYKKHGGISTNLDDTDART